MSLTAALTAETRIIGIGAVNDITLYREMIDVGATAYVVKPVTEKALTLALQRANETTASTSRGRPAAMAKRTARALTRKTKRHAARRPLQISCNLASRAPIS